MLRRSSSGRHPCCIARRGCLYPRRRRVWRRALRTSSKRASRAGIAGVFSRRPSSGAFGIEADRRDPQHRRRAGQSDAARRRPVSPRARAGVRICSPVADQSDRGRRLRRDADRRTIWRSSAPVGMLLRLEVMKAIPERAIRSDRPGRLPPRRSPRRRRGFAITSSGRPPTRISILRLTRDGPHRRRRRGRALVRQPTPTEAARREDRRRSRRSSGRSSPASVWIAYRWAGAFGESSTGLPYIDAVPGHPVAMRSWVLAGTASPMR